MEKMVKNAIVVIDSAIADEIEFLKEQAGMVTITVEGDPTATIEWRSNLLDMLEDMRDRLVNGDIPNEAELRDFVESCYALTAVGEFLYGDTDWCDMLEEDLMRQLGLAKVKTLGSC